MTHEKRPVFASCIWCTRVSLIFTHTTAKSTFKEEDAARDRGRRAADPPTLRHKCGTSAAQVRHKCGASAAQVRHKCGTSAAQVRHKCGTSAAQVRHKCGTSAEQVLSTVRIACGTPADVRRGVFWQKHPQKNRKTPPKAQKHQKRRKKHPTFFSPSGLFVGARTDPLRNGGGTGAAAMRHRCGTGAALVRHRCGTGADRVRNAGIAGQIPGNGNKGRVLPSNTRGITRYLVMPVFEVPDGQRQPRGHTTHHSCGGRARRRPEGGGHAEIKPAATLRSG